MYPIITKTKDPKPKRVYNKIFFINIIIYFNIFNEQLMLAVNKSKPWKIFLKIIKDDKFNMFNLFFVLINILRIQVYNFIIMNMYTFYKYDLEHTLESTLFAFFRLGNLRFWCCHSEMVILRRHSLIC